MTKFGKKDTTKIMRFNGGFNARKGLPSTPNIDHSNSVSKKNLKKKKQI